MKDRTKILLIYTGGTIGMVKEYGFGALKAFDFDKLVKNIPELSQLNCDIDSISFDNPMIGYEPRALGDYGFFDRK